MFHSYFERKNIKVLTFNIVHFPNFEINASLGGGGGGVRNLQLPESHL